MTKSSSSGMEQAVISKDPDVIIEILMRLPLKSLLRFRCVCKWWNQIISDPLFISNYTRCNPQHQVSGFYMQKFLFLRLYSELRFIPCTGQLGAAPNPSLSFIEDENGVCIKHSCNGLLLCSSFRCCLEQERKYYLCKPTTKQYMPLPRPECKKMSFCLKGGSFGRVQCIGLAREVLSLRFDVERELLLTMPMPPIPEGWAERRLKYFGESGGHLYLIEIYGPQTSVFDVMEMSGDYSSWFVKYHVVLDGLVAMNPRIRRDNAQDIHRIVFNVLHLVHRRSWRK
uniref:F-box domain-containing protein n=1 Tax=Fagus sylvatica TaxID=28930 RepID=A0A2N9HU30_FAGSY